MNSAYCGVCGRRYSECVCGPADQGVERAADILAARIEAERARIAALERVAEAARNHAPHDSALAKALQDLDGNPADPKAPLSKGPNCARDAGEKERAP